MRCALQPVAIALLAICCASPTRAVDGTWQAVGTGAGFNAVALGATVVGDDVYVAGAFSHVDGVPVNGIARWDGSAWHPLGTGLSGGEGDAVVALDGSIYVVGKFSAAGGVPAARVARWDGTAWHALGAGLPDHPYAAVVHDGKLHVGGGSPAWVRRWDGAAWTTLGTADGGWVYAMASFRGRLVVGGDWSSFEGNGVPRIARLVDGAWLGLDGGMDGTVSGLRATSSHLYAAGAFANAGSTPAASIARWDGSRWRQVGPGISPGNAGTAVIGQDGVFVGGSFNAAGGTPATNVAFWNGSAWSALGNGVGPFSHLWLERYRTGLLAIGDFGSAGGLSVGGVALYRFRWTSNRDDVAASAEGDDDSLAFDYLEIAGRSCGRGSGGGSAAAIGLLVVLGVAFRGRRS